MATEKWTTSDLMVVRSARELRDDQVVFVGIGLPSLACNLARLTHAPELCMIYESGPVGTVPERLPLSIGDPCLVTDSVSVCSQADIFQCYLQRGLIDLGFIGGAQVDRFGNINTTVIGDYANPTVRLPGSGGACEIAVHAKRVLIMMKMSPKAFVEHCDFITSPGHRFEGRSRSQLGLPGGGPYRVITDLGVLDFVDGEMMLTEIYPGVEIAKVRASCGWDLKISQEPRVFSDFSEDARNVLHDKLDPEGIHLK